MRNGSSASYQSDSPYIGKVPPQAPELEEAVLGAAMLEKEAIDKVAELLTPECFYVDAHQRIFRAMVTLHREGRAIDILTINEQLKKTEEAEIVGGAYFVTKLTNTVVSAANIEEHAKIIYEKFLLREQIRVCGEGIQQAYEPMADGFSTLDTLAANVTALNDLSSKPSSKHLSGLLVERFTRLAELKDRPDHLTGVPTGFRELDLLTAGWQNTDLIIVAARPSVGKTAFALNLARNAACHRSKPTPVAFFSMEMSDGQLTDRLLSAESGIDLDLITRAKLNDEQMQRLYTTGVQPLATYPLHIDDTGALNIFQLRSKARKLKKQHNIGLIVIDYLQLMSGLENKTVKNREQEIANVSRGLKALAKELKVPIIALSQLSRDIEKGKRDPQLSDLRESGAIEQDADMVLFLTRPDYQQTDQVGEAVTDMADIHVKKHRNGALSKIPMNTVLNIQRWMSPMEYTTYKSNLNAPQIGKFRRLNQNELPPTGTDDTDPF